MNCKYCIQPEGRHLPGCSNIEYDLVQTLVKLAEVYESEFELKDDAQNFTDDVVDLLHTYRQLNYGRYLPE